MTTLPIKINVYHGENDVSIDIVDPPSHDDDQHPYTYVCRRVSSDTDEVKVLRKAIEMMKLSLAELTEWQRSKKK